MFLISIMSKGFKVALSISYNDDANTSHWLYFSYMDVRYLTVHKPLEICCYPEYDKYYYYCCYD